MDDKQFRQILKAFVEEHVPMQTIVGTVESLENADVPKYCRVKPISGPLLYKVALKSGSEDDASGIVQIPEVGSIVLVGIKQNQKNAAYVLKCSKVSSVVIDGGANGGLIKIEELKAQYLKTKLLLDAITEVINGVPIPEAGNGAPSGLQTALKTAITSMQTGSLENIENTKVKH
jgi:hypothetical protein